ncbi:MAG TPA: DUF4435 domain-containing protein [Candidatus Angelobacter sp.]|nr:DUF4435 domain-containing protein [Candidatus Angelobacter sp.]
MNISFHRTQSGLNNLALFLRVEAIVFTEGGEKNLTIDEVMAGERNESTHDVMFWQVIFDSFAPLRKVQFRSIGSKPTLLSIANMIIAGKISRIIVALDRDFDHASNSLLSHSNVVYTRGYSWENEVWTPEIIAKVVARLSLDRTLSAKVRAEANNAFRNAHAIFESIVRLDFSLAISSRNLCNRKDLMASVRPGVMPPPCIERTSVAILLRGTRTQNPGIKRSKHDRVDMQLDLHGHTVAKLGLAVLQENLRKVARLKLSNDACIRLAISTLRSVIRRRGPRQRYYLSAVSAIVW